MSKKPNVMIYLDDSEKQEIKAAAGVEGKSVSAYVREQALASASATLSNFARNRVKNESARSTP